MTDERTEELEAVQAIFPEFIFNGDGTGGFLDIPVRPIKPLLVRFVPLADSRQTNGNLHLQAHIEHDILFTALPPITLELSLPPGYPESMAPEVTVSCAHDWLPTKTKLALDMDASKIWEEYAHGQCLYAYIDHLVNQAEAGFDLDREGCLTLPQHLEASLTNFEASTKLFEFNKGTYDCSVCLEPKKGTACYQLSECNHIFCKKCLQDFYNNAIREGDIAVVRCLDPDCAKDKREKSINIHPRELLAMDIAEQVVRRYVEMKRKKLLEADKTTVYCPRSWCQGAARSLRYPPIPKDLSQYVEYKKPSLSNPAKNGAQEINDNGDDNRLSICEKCSFAFCRTCFASWHGSFVRCRPRDPSELTAEEKASYDYIRQHTSPCPTCSSPTQKTMGCNHMHCFQCRTHFCYLCGAWLDGSNPYEHFNTPGRECYQRLWELEGGDEGQAPADGRGFAGARAWEALVMDAAQQADRHEVGEANVLHAAVGQLQIGPDQVIQMVDDRLDIQQPAPMVAHGRANGRAQGQRGRGGGAPVLPEVVDAGVRRRVGDNEHVRQEDELRRFVRLAERDEEDGWNSDELTDDDEAWRIR